MHQNIVLHVAYDGTKYLGWQRTSLDHAHFPSIEEEIQRVLERILQHPVVLQAASRTDRGVHAEGQVVNFLTTKLNVCIARLQLSLNQLLPRDIVVTAAQLVQDVHFHATIDAKAKEYVYRLCKGPFLLPSLRFTYWHFPCELDMEKMVQAAAVLTGEHDFASFRNFRKGKDYNDTVRSMYAISIVADGPNAILFRLTAHNFLYKMARNIVGTLVYVGTNRISVGEVARLLSAPDRTKAGVTAPACGLCLQHVFYEHPLYSEGVTTDFS
jgi:tRNA pseudouridine38-40 synthase